MSRIQLIGCGLAAAWLVAGPPAARADEPSSPPQGTYAQTRKELDQQYNQWLRERNARYQQWRMAQDSAAGNNPAERAFELRSTEIPPGRYGLSLPDHSHSEVVVRKGLPGKATPARISQDTYRLASQMTVWLQGIVVGLSQQENHDLQGQAQAALEESRRLARMAMEGADLTAIRGQFKKFDDTWQRLAYVLESRAKRDTWMQERYNGVQQDDQMLRQVLNAAPAQVYDRLMVATLTKRLDDLVGDMVTKVESQAPQPMVGGDVLRDARRAKQLADDLASAVQEGNGLAAVTEDFSQFDEMWRRLALRTTGGITAVDQEVQRTARRIWPVTRELQKQLLVYPPVYTLRDQTMNLASLVSRTADELVTVLRTDLRWHEPGVSYSAEDFAQSARGLLFWLQGHRRPQITQPEVRRLMDSWRRLDNSMERLQRGVYPDAWAVADQLKTDVNQLYSNLQRSSSARSTVSAY